MSSKLKLTLELSQAESHALHQAVDNHFYGSLFCELVQEMHEKVSDALLCAGYCPEEGAALPTPVGREDR